MSKISIIKQELSSLNRQQLEEKIELYRQDVFKLKLSAATAQGNSATEVKKSRKNLARALTYWQQQVNEGA